MLNEKEKNTVNATISSVVFCHMNCSYSERVLLRKCSSQNDNNPIELPRRGLGQKKGKYFILVNILNNYKLKIHSTEPAISNQSTMLVAAYVSHASKHQAF